MEKLRKNHSSKIIDRALRHLCIQLNANPVTRHYVMHLEQTRKKLESTESELKKIHALRLASTKNVWSRDKALNKAAMTLALDTLVLTQNDRKDPRFLNLFPAAPSKAMMPVASESKIELVSKIMETLCEKGELAPLSRHLDTLARAKKELEEALAQRRDLEAPEKNALAARDEAKGEAVKSYNMMHARLQILFDDDQKAVNAYFPRLKGLKEAP